MNTVIRNETNSITAFMLEARVIAGIALPLILASLVNMSISITDVVMMGWLGTSSLAAGAIVSDYYSIFFYFCSGILAASSPLIARAIGESRYSRIGNIVQQALLLALSLSLPGALIVYNADVPLHMIGIKQEIIETGLPYARIMAVTFTVMLLVNVLHHFLAAHQKTRVILLITALSMPLNALGNYMFMFGYADIEPMGLAGAAMSSCITAVFILAGMIIYIARSRAFADYSIVTRFHRKNMTHIKEILPYWPPNRYIQSRRDGSIPVLYRNHGCVWRRCTGFPYRDITHGRCCVCPANGICPGCHSTRRLCTG